MEEKEIKNWEIKVCGRCGDCCRTDTLLKTCSLPMRIFIRIIYFLKGKSVKITQCRNLTFENGLAVCKIYESRPKFCREYFCNKAKF